MSHRRPRKNVYSKRVKNIMQSSTSASCQVVSREVTTCPHQKRWRNYYYHYYSSSATQVIKLTCRVPQSFLLVHPPKLVLHFSHVYLMQDWVNHFNLQNLLEGRLHSIALSRMDLPTHWLDWSHPRQEFPGLCSVQSKMRLIHDGIGL